jgi:hypothetical protein
VFLDVPVYLPLLLTSCVVSKVRLLFVAAVAMQYAVISTLLSIENTSTYLEDCLRWESLDTLLSDTHHSMQQYNNLEGEREYKVQRPSIIHFFTCSSRSF